MGLGERGGQLMNLLYTMSAAVVKKVITALNTIPKIISTKLRMIAGRIIAADISNTSRLVK